MSMQKLRIRLLRTDKTSPSGYRIDGWMRIEVGYVEVKYLDDDDWVPLEYQDWDAYDLGVKVGDEWMYAGDRAEYDGGIDPLFGTIIFTGFTWYYERDDGTRYKLADVKDFLTRTGRTIHDMEGS